MGRRALPRIDSSLDLSQHLRYAEDLSTPLEWGSFFSRTAPLEIEVGSGKGLFLVTESRLHPERNYLGCEISRKYVRYAAAKLAGEARTNAMMIQGDAQFLFRECITDASAAAVHVYFPDPWWKKRHKRRRVLNEAFLREIQRVLEPSGCLHFWTDVEEYFRSTLDLIATATDLDGPCEVNEKTAEHDMDYRTHFERRVRLDEQPVYRAIYYREPQRID